MNNLSEELSEILISLKNEMRQDIWSFLIYLKANFFFDKTLFDIYEEEIFEKITHNSIVFKYDEDVNKWYYFIGEYYDRGEGDYSIDFSRSKARELLLETINILKQVSCPNDMERLKMDINKSIISL